MRDTINCIKKYIKIINDNNFMLHWEELSNKLMTGIQNSYNNREDSIVKIIESIIGSMGAFKTKKKIKGRQGFEISTNSIFIHGTKSQVEFKYYDKDTQRELGDIIFILSVVYNNKKYFEKMTINQVKKSKGASWRFYSQSAKEQTYLLSRFPAFKGVEGALIPSKKYILPNNSGCLGSHGLLYSPGDFVLISSKEIEVLLSKKKTIWFNDLSSLGMKFIPTTMCPCCLLFDSSVEECLYIFHMLTRFSRNHVCHTCFLSICNLPVVGNSWIAYNVYDFANKYLLGLIGELICAEKLPYNRFAFQFLQDLLDAIRKKAKKGHSKDVLSFLDSFYHYKYANSSDEEKIEDNGYYEGGGIGIIHTTVNLGEGE